MQDRILEHEGLIVGAFEDPNATGITVAIEDDRDPDNDMVLTIHTRADAITLARLMLDVAQYAHLPPTRTKPEDFVPEVDGIDTRLDAIKDLPIRVRWRLTNILKLKTVRDLVEKTTARRLLKMDNMGAVAVEKIRAAIKPFGAELEEK